MAEVGRAGSIGAAGRAGKDLAADARGVDHEVHVLEDAALDDDVGAAVDLEGVAGIGVPVVVHGVQQGVSGDLGRATGGVVDIIAFEGNEIVGTGEVHGPVMVAITGGGPR